MKMQFKKMWKHAFQKCENMLKTWKCGKMWNKWEQKAVEKFLFLSSIFPIFPRYNMGVFQVFFETQCWNIEC